MIKKIGLKKWVGLSTLAVILPVTGFSQDLQKGKALYSQCIQCHGENGMGDPAQEAPKLAGQFDWYIVSQLEAFQKKERHNPKMYPFIENLSGTDFKNLAAYISTLK